MASNPAGSLSVWVLIGSRMSRLEELYALLGTRDNGYPFKAMFALEALMPEMSAVRKKCMH